MKGTLRILLGLICWILGTTVTLNHGYYLLSLALVIWSGFFLVTGIGAMVRAKDE